MKKKNTAEYLEILTWREAVRKRPAMYTGSTGNLGFVNLLKDFFANFYFFIDPSKMLEAEKLSFEITGKQSGKFHFEKLKTKIPLNINETLNLRRWDFAVLNALSRNYEFTMFDRDKNEIFKQIYQKGILQSGTVEEKEITADSLEISFVLDDTIWDDFEINPYFVSDIVKEIAFLKNNQTFEVKYSVNNESSRVIYHFENGMKDLVNIEGFKGWGGIIFETDTEYKSEDFSADICFAFRNYSIDEPFFKSFVNYHYTHEGGNHTDALLSGIGKALKKYVKKHKPDDFFVITKRTILSSLVGAIHLKMKQPRFYGSTKNSLDNKEIIKPISDFIFTNLYEKLESDNEKAADVIRHFYDSHWKKNWFKRL